MSMEVKPIHPAPNFKVSSADETRDEERQKRDPRGSRDGKDAKDGKDRQHFGKAIDSKASPTDNKAEPSTDNTSMSQLIDSKKVVELLSHKPQAQSRRRLAFQSPKKMGAAPEPSKKFDRSF